MQGCRRSVRALSKEFVIDTDMDKRKRKVNPKYAVDAVSPQKKSNSKLTFLCNQTFFGCRNFIFLLIGKGTSSKTVLDPELQSHLEQIPRPVVSQGKIYILCS